MTEEQTQMGGSPYLSDEYQFYYSNRWQVLAEYNAKEFASESFAGEQEEEEGETMLMSSPGGTATYERTHVWSPGYVDEMVLRDEHAEIDDPVEGLSTSDIRLYVQQDANFNVTSVTSDSGAVQERYIYDPYGQPTYLDASWSNLGASVNNWVYLHQGGRLDGVTTLYHFRNRDYSASLGRWVQQDPLGYPDGANRYEAVLSSPIGILDPSGTSIAGLLRALRPKCCDELLQELIAADSAVLIARAALSRADAALRSAVKNSLEKRIARAEAEVALAHARYNETWAWINVGVVGGIEGYENPPGAEPNPIQNDQLQKNLEVLQDIYLQAKKRSGSS